LSPFAPWNKGRLFFHYGRRPSQNLNSINRRIESSCADRATAPRETRLHGDRIRWRSEASAPLSRGVLCGAAREPRFSCGCTRNEVLSEGGLRFFKLLREAPARPQKKQGALARFSLERNRSRIKKSRRIKKLERILIAKVCQLLQNLF